MGSLIITEPLEGWGSSLRKRFKKIRNKAVGRIVKLSPAHKLARRLKKRRRKGRRKGRRNGAVVATAPVFPATSPRSTPEPAMSPSDDQDFVDIQPAASSPAGGGGRGGPANSPESIYESEPIDLYEEPEGTTKWQDYAAHAPRIHWRAGSVLDGQTYMQFPGVDRMDYTDLTVVDSDAGREVFSNPHEGVWDAESSFISSEMREDDIARHQQASAEVASLIRSGKITEDDIEGVEAFVGREIAYLDRRIGRSDDGLSGGLSSLYENLKSKWTRYVWNDSLSLSKWGVLVGIAYMLAQVGASLVTPVGDKVGGALAQVVSGIAICFSTVLGVWTVVNVVDSRALRGFIGKTRRVSRSRSRSRRKKLA